MSDVVKQAVDRFKELAYSALAQHAEEDDEAIATVLGLAASRLRPEFGDTVADVALSAVDHWREIARVNHEHTS